MCLHIYWAEQNIERTIETLIRQCPFTPLLWAETTIKEQQKLVTINSDIRNICWNHLKIWTRGPWATMLSWMYSYDGYIQSKYCQCCMQEKLNFCLPLQLIKFSSLDLIHMFVRGLLKEHCCKTFLKIPKSQIKIKAYFHFSHYKSMET